MSEITMDGSEQLAKPRLISPHATQASVNQFGGIAWRIAGILFGIGTQVLFGYTVLQLFVFLRYGSATPPTQGSLGLFWNLLLAIGFAWPHTLLLIPRVQGLQRKYIPAGWLGCVHCSVTCLSLLLLFMSWRTSGYQLWDLNGAAEMIVLIGFYGSWIALFYSLYLTGLGYQTGLTQWWYWVRGTKPPRREFVIRGAYRWLRHPVYLSFLGLIWFTPHMSLDHAILTTVWTIYIFLGSSMKDRRLEHFIGQEYRNYAAQVAGYPWIGFGRLGKWKDPAEVCRSV